MEDAYYLSLKKKWKKVSEKRGVSGECCNEAKIKESQGTRFSLHHIKKVQCKLHMNLYFHVAPISVSETHTHARRLDTFR